MATVGLQTTACSEFMLAQNFMQSRFAAHMNEHGLSFATSEEYNVRLSIFAKKDAKNAWQAPAPSQAEVKLPDKYTLLPAPRAACGGTPWAVRVRGATSRL